MSDVIFKDERRDFSRIALARPTLLRVRGGTERCQLVDISLQGALVRLPWIRPAAVGDLCTLVVALDEGLARIRMEGVVAHRGEQTVGIRCCEIDLDSVVFLRRLLEVNLGNDRLLLRELAALASSRRASPQRPRARG